MPTDETRQGSLRRGTAARVEISRNQVASRARSGSAAEMDRWINSINKAKAAEGDSLLNREVKDIIASETLNELRELRTYLQQTEWMFADEG